VINIEAIFEVMHVELISSYVCHYCLYFVLYFLILLYCVM